MADKIKLQHFRNLISLSAADGKLEEAEKNTLIKIANEQDIPMDRLEVMLKYAHEYIYVVPQNQIDREDQLKAMIDLALVDGEFTKTEFDLIRMVAGKLGFSHAELIQIMEPYPGLSDFQ